MEFICTYCSGSEEGSSCFVDILGKQYFAHQICSLEHEAQNLVCELEEAKRLLQIARIKLVSPGRYEVFAEEIERFLNK